MNQSSELTSECIFCDKQLPSVDCLLPHMEVEHGFFIRHRDCLINFKGLMRCLKKRIDQENECLHCGRYFNNSEAARQHMVHQGHCFMPQEEFDMMSKYYDFTEKLLRQLMNVPEPSISDSFSVMESVESEEFQHIDEMEASFDKIELIPDYKIRQEVLNNLLKQIAENKAKMLPNGELRLSNGRILGHRAYRQTYHMLRRKKL